MDWPRMMSILRSAEGYAALGMREEALLDLSRVPTRLREGREYLEAATLVHQHLADWPRTAELAARLLEVDPMNLSAIVSGAYATRRARGIREAQTILRRGERLHPEEAIIKYNLGCYAAQLGEVEEAVRYVQSAIKLEKAYAELVKTDADLDPVRDKLRAELEPDEVWE